MGTEAERKPATQLGGAKVRFWHLRFWDGMSLGGWLRLVARNRFAIAPQFVPMALVITCLGFVHWALWLVQELIYGRRIARTEIKNHPIFIIGHWRSGTTLLHEFLAMDARHTSSNTYACFVPNHFLVSSWILPPLLQLLMPSQRPMDNMAAGWSHPQEDEFALCNMGIPSPYLTMAFPRRPQHPEYLDLEGLSSEELGLWKRAFLWFLKCITLRDPRRLVLKSPPHTCRIKVLLELFPDARFIHITRDPQVIFPSTVNLWKRLRQTQGVQVSRDGDLDEYVFKTFERMYEVFDRDRHLIPPSRLCEVRYEDLVEDPVGQLRAIYDGLELGEFDTVLPAIQTYLAQQSDYKVNRYQISAETRAQIARRWAGYLEQYGYTAEPAEV